MFLHDYLAGLGVTGLDTVQLANCRDISPDGKTVIGCGVNYNTFAYFW